MINEDHLFFWSHWKYHVHLIMSVQYNLNSLDYFLLKKKNHWFILLINKLDKSILLYIKMNLFFSYLKKKQKKKTTHYLA